MDAQDFLSKSLLASFPLIHGRLRWSMEVVLDSANHVLALSSSGTPGLCLGSWHNSRASICTTLIFGTCGLEQSQMLQASIPSPMPKAGQICTLAILDDVRTVFSTPYLELLEW